MKKILVIGATSAIAEACARRWAAHSDRLFLAARDQPRLAAIAADLRIRGASEVFVSAFDALDYPSHAPLVEQARQTLGGLDLVFIAHGSLPDAAACETDTALAVRQSEINALSMVSLIMITAQQLRAQGWGTLAVISSVAGDRGRGSNYLYGASKALVSTLLDGLRHRLQGSGIQVVTIKPGMIATPMTEGMGSGPLWSTPELIAPSIVAAIDHGRRVVYVPGFWRLIMIVIRCLPEALFLRTRL